MNKKYFSENLNKNTPQKGNRKPGDSPKNLRKKSKDPLNIFQWKRAGKTSLIWVLIIVAAIFLSDLFTEGSRKETEINYFKYKEFLEDRLISKADVFVNIFHGELNIPQTIISYGFVHGFKRRFVTSS